MQNLKIISGLRMFFLQTIFCLFVYSCKPTEDTGLGQYFLANNSDYDLQIEAYYVAGVVVFCDSCTIPAHSIHALGHDSNFGHAPTPNETINQIKVFKNDTLKFQVDNPFADTTWTLSSGKNSYDIDFTLSLNNDNVK